MKKIKIAGKIVEQVVEPLDCVECPYNDSCTAWVCCSAACGLTNECFGYNYTASWCPFGEIPEDKKQSVEIL